MSKADLLRIPGRRYQEQYVKEYNEKELAEIRAEFVEKSAELHRLEEEKKTFNDDMKDQMSPIKDELKRLLPICSNGSEIVNAEVEYLIDDETGTVNFVDPETGESVGSRRLRSEERLPLVNSHLEE